MRHLLRLTLLFALLLAGVPAHATILFVGGEDIDFALTGAPTTTTTAGQFRSGYARAAINVPAANGTMTTPVFANQSTIWLHFTHIENDTRTNTNGIIIYGSDGNPAIQLYGTGSFNQYAINKINTSSSVTTLVTCTGNWALSSLTQVDFALNYAVSGSATLYVNQNPVCSFTGDVTTNSRTAVNKVSLASLGFSTFGDTTSFSEVVVSTGITLGYGVVTLAPVANGNTMAWTGVVGNVNPTTINDSNNINTGTNNLLAEFTVGSLPSGTWQIVTVKQAARMLIGSSGPQNFSFVQRVSGSDFTGCSTAGTTSYLNYTCYLPTSPATSAQWLSSELGAGVNFGVKSLP